MPVSLLGQAVGDYRVIAPLGVGGTGAVYLAEDPLLGRRVAVKVLHPELARDAETVERFFAEARAASALGDPGIARVLESGRAETMTYMVVEHVDGRTLGELLEDGALSPAQALDVAESIAGILDHAHAHGVVHGALKSENVFILERHRGVFDVKLVDFGVRRFRCSRSTAAYLAPEQCAGFDAEIRSDVYALGVLLFEMLSGKRPFGGAEDEMVLGHLGRRAPRLATSSLPVEAVVARALAKRRAHRFQTMAELREALLDPPRYLESISIEPALPAPLVVEPTLPAPAPVALAIFPAPPPPLPAPIETAPVRRRLPLFAASGLALVIALVGALRVVATPPACGSPQTLTVAGTGGGCLVAITVAKAGLPAGARIHMAGVDVGVPGQAIAVARSSERIVVSVHAPGFLPMVIRVVPDRDRQIDAVLVPRPPSPSFL